jgi:hypothetical protein
MHGESWRGAKQFLDFLLYVAARMCCGMYTRGFQIKSFSIYLSLAGLSLHGLAVGC